MKMKTTTEDEERTMHRLTKRNGTHCTHCRIVDFAVQKGRPRLWLEKDRLSTGYGVMSQDGVEDPAAGCNKRRLPPLIALPLDCTDPQTEFRPNNRSRKKIFDT